MITTADQKLIRPHQRTPLYLSLKLVCCHELSTIDTEHVQCPAIIPDKNATVVDKGCGIGWPGKSSPPDNMPRAGVKLPETVSGGSHKERPLMVDR
jgi:hypothetical protein